MKLVPRLPTKLALLAALDPRGAACHRSPCWLIGLAPRMLREGVDATATSSTARSGCRMEGRVPLLLLLPPRRAGSVDPIPPREALSALRGFPRSFMGSMILC